MCTVFRFGIGIVCLCLSAPVLAQMDDELPDYGTNCRAVVAHANIDGTEQQIVGRACLQRDGTWQIVQSDDGSVLWYPAAAYPYPDPWYWGPQFRQMKALQELMTTVPGVLQQPAPSVKVAEFTALGPVLGIGVHCKPVEATDVQAAATNAAADFLVASGYTVPVDTVRNLTAKAG